MKKLLLLISIVALVSCNNEEQAGPKKTGYQEYTMTVASQKVQGVVGIGVNVLSDVYAVKKNNQGDWSSFSGFIKGFEYEAGYEYVIKIGETNFLDYSMGDPAWTEYNFIQVISKDPKNSEGLPEDFIPNWYNNQ